MEFVAREAGLRVGNLTVISTHATIDQPKSKMARTSRGDIDAMLDRFDQASAASALVA
jgi:hypothetical protein